MKNYKTKTINYSGCNRCTPRDSYYQTMFADFKSDDITVPERSPMSPQNGGYAARNYWRRADEDEAKRTLSAIWFKNASWYGGSQFYIKDRHEGGRNTPRPAKIEYGGKKCGK